MADDGLSSMGFSKEKWDEMMKLLDKDNSGDVDKHEYKAVFEKMFPEKTKEDFEAQWNKMDADGDGNLTVIELAKHYGFNLEGESSAGMTDEQILEALQMQAALVEMEAAKAAQLAAERQAKLDAEEAERAAKGLTDSKVARDKTLKMVRATSLLRYPKHRAAEIGCCNRMSHVDSPSSFDPPSPSTRPHRRVVHSLARHR